MPDHELQIRSFRVVFDLERRIHRVDRWRLPFPYGLPLHSLAYAGAALVVVTVAARLPGANTLMMVLPAPARLVLAPVAISYALTRLHVDGRTAHAAAFALVAHLSRPHRLHAWRAATELGHGERLGNVVVAPDAGGIRVRKGTVRGPATVVLWHPAEAVRRGRTLLVRQRAERNLAQPTRVTFDASRRVVLR